MYIGTLTITKKGGGARLSGFIRQILPWSEMMWPCKCLLNYFNCWETNVHIFRVLINHKFKKTIYSKCYFFILMFSFHVQEQYLQPNKPHIITLSFDIFAMDKLLIKHNSFLFRYYL